MGDTPNVSNSLTIRVQFKNDSGMLGRLASEVGRLGGDIGAVDLVSVGDGLMVRYLTVNCRDDEHAAALIAGIRALDDFTLLHSSDRTFLLHLGGKIEVVSRVPIRTRDDLSMVYTPGVARVCMAIHARPEDAYSLAIKRNTVAVVTDPPSWDSATSVPQLPCRSWKASVRSSRSSPGSTPSRWRSTPPIPTGSSKP